MTTTAGDPQAAARSPVRWADGETLQAVRPAVRQLLESSESFGKLPPEEQHKLAGEMVKVAAYMSDPDGVTRKELARDQQPLVIQQAEDPNAAARRRATEGRFAGEQFEAGAVREGVEQFGELVKKVDFPLFVSGLIEGVFTSIVDSTLRQMRAYGELLANVSKTVDQFAQDNITENNARDWLVERFPDSLELDTQSTSGSFAEGDAPPQPQPTVVVKAEDPEEALRAISTALNLPKPITDISDPTTEAELVRQAKLQIARGRQQLLASMVMLGINRIVVTDGLINAKVVFDLRASDQAKRHATASMYDRASSSLATSSKIGYGAWFSPVSASSSIDARSDHVATVQSSVDDNSESKAEVKAKLSGEVRVNFKSDYLPLEKMANPQMIAAIQGNSVPPAKPVEGT